MATDLGFGAKLGQTQRLINKDGSFNVRRKSAHPLQHFSLYHALISMSWGKFILLVLAFYIIVNALFAGLYMAVGIEHLSNAPMEESAWDQFLHAYFFSAQTVTTVGYGAVAPVGIPTNIVAAVEALFGLLVFALATGLLYGRFAQPKSRILFSKQIVMAPYKDGVNGLMFRVVNATDSQVINMEAKVFLAYFESTGPERKRQFKGLPLEISLVSLLSLSWTLVHAITPESPLYDKSHEEIAAMDAEVIVLITGYDNSFAQEVNARTSYTYDEFMYGQKFKMMFEPQGSGTLLDLDKLSDSEDAVLF